MGRISIIFAVPFYTFIFLSVARWHGRTDLAMQALLAPALAGMWTLALVLAGDIIFLDKRWDLLEPLLAAPTTLFRVVVGRTAAVGILGVVCFLEAWLVGLLGFGAHTVVLHPVWFVAALVVTVFAMAGTSTVMAGLFVLGRSA